MLIKTNKHTIELVVDAAVIGKDTERTRIATDVEQALQFGNGEMMVSIIHDASFDMPEYPQEMEDHLFSEKFACPVCNISITEVEPRIFSFNTPHGACPVCSGIGRILNVDRELVFNDNLTINEGGIVPFFNIGSGDSWFSRTFKTFCDENGIRTNVKMSELDRGRRDMLLNGTGKKEYYVKGENRWGRETVISEPFRGISYELRRRYDESDSQFMKTQIEKYMRYDVCPECNGARLKKEALSVTVNGKSIVDVSDMPIGHAKDFADSLQEILSPREQEIAKLLVREIRQRISFLVGGSGIFNLEPNSGNVSRRRSTTYSFGFTNWEWTHRRVIRTG